MLGNRKIIALCISGIHEMMGYEFMTTLNEKISKLGYTLFVYSTCTELGEYNTSVYGQASVFGLMDFNIIDAVIIFNEKLKNEAITDDIINRAEAHGKPVTVIGEKHPGCTHIDFDNAYGFELIARHVLETHGVSKIYFLAGDKGNFYSEQRLDALKSVLKDNNIDFKESMISYCGFCYEHAVNLLVDSNSVPDAVICANDAMAIAAVGAFARRGIKVPDDVIVTGYDGINEIEFTSPRITSVKCCYSVVAEKLAEILPDIIEGKLKDRSFAIAPELTLSESCGCVSRDAVSAAHYMNTLNNRFNRYQKEGTEFAEMSAKAQVCENLEQLSALFNDWLLYDMCCFRSKDRQSLSFKDAAKQHAAIAAGNKVQY